MNGVINVLKPPGMTSHDVVSFIRKQFKLKRVGHTGTLDPQASGVLPVCVGQATRLADILSAHKKEYLCRMRLGITTTTQDAWGALIESTDASFVTEDMVNKVLSSFKGTIRQKVPDFSAVKVDGQPLYKKARLGEKIEPIMRTIDIYKLELLEFKNKEISLDIGCSKGTYIRALCDDIGKMLATGGHMSFLLRTVSGSFKVQDSFTLEEIADRKYECLLPMSKCIEGIPAIQLNGEDADAIRHGRSILLSDEHCNQPGMRKYINIGVMGEMNIIAMLNPEHNLLALGEIPSYTVGTIIKPKKVFNPE